MGKKISAAERLGEVAIAERRGEDSNLTLVRG